MKVSSTLVAVAAITSSLTLADARHWYDIPYMVALHQRQSSSATSYAHCAGVFVAPDLVLTAASCARPDYVRASGRSYQSYVNRYEKTYQVDKSIQHPSFDAAKMTNDLQILKLTEKPSGVTPITLTQADDTNCVEGGNATVVGWGSQQQQPVYLLEFTPVVFLANGKCKDSYYKDDSRPVDVSEVCVVSTSVVLGDVGGPVVVTKDNLDVLVGVSSWAKTKSPSVYTRVSSHLEWIQATIKQLSQ